MRTLVFLLTAALTAAPVFAATATPTASTPHAGPLPWLADDYPAALAAARAADVPLVIDLWAPWCHSCRSMQHTVLAADGLRAVAPRFVWLSMNTDTPAAAATTTRFPQSAWPTFLVVDPFTETVQARHVGTASPEIFAAFLTEGERAFVEVRGRAGALGPKDPRRHMRTGDHAALAGDPAAAATAYAAALKVGGARWPGRAAARVSLAGALAAAKRFDACVELGLETSVAPADGPSAADFVSLTLDCADQRPATDPRAERQKLALRRAAIETLTRITDDAKAPLSPDDRADALRMLREVHTALGETEAARGVAERARTLLDAAFEGAGSPAYAATFNMALVDVYTFLGRGEALVPRLTANVAALPGEYDPPYRLAQLHLALKQPDAARAPAEQALARVQGPRTVRVLELLRKVHLARGDAAAVSAIDARLAAAGASGGR
jgi:thiol-disulfide isomerase/thioredoxin